MFWGKEEDRHIIYNFLEAKARYTKVHIFNDLQNQ